MCYLQLVSMFPAEGSCAATDTSSVRVSWNGMWKCAASLRHLICEGSFSNIWELDAEFCIEHSGVYLGLYRTEMYFLCNYVTCIIFIRRGVLTEFMKMIVCYLRLRLPDSNLSSCHYTNLNVRSVSKWPLCIRIVTFRN